MDNVDIKKMMEMLSKMDKRELEAGLEKVSKMMKEESKDEILKKINNSK